MKPANCTCQYPEIIIRNMNGHDTSCPVYIEWANSLPTDKYLGFTDNGTQYVPNIDNTYKSEGEPMRRFYLNRLKDETGVSRTGRVLEGCVTQSGKVFVEWRPPHSTIGIYNSFEEFKTIHVDCHPSCNQVVFIDCYHPPLYGESVAFVSQETFNSLKRAGVRNVSGSRLVVDENISDSLVHFPNADGTCKQYNV